MKNWQKKHLVPFSHVLGAEALIPGGSFSLKAFPTRLFVFENSGTQAQKLLDIAFEIEGGIGQFTLFQNLEKEILLLSGKIEDEVIRWVISHRENHLEFLLKKGPKKGVMCSHTPNLLLPDTLNQGEGERCKKRLLRGDRLLFKVAQKSLIKEETGSKERLFLGSHKAQDMEKIQKRGSLEEILPLWFFLGGHLTPSVKKGKGGVLPLLETIEEGIKKKTREEVAKHFLTLFRVGFKSLLVPYLKDQKYQGLFVEAPIDERDSPLALLNDGARLIRSLFIAEEGDAVLFLPCLPKKLISGRMTDVASFFGTIDFEWTKGKMRRLLIRSQKEEEVSLRFPKEVKRFRLRLYGRQRGKELDAGQSLFLEKGKTYLLDRFQR